MSAVTKNKLSKEKKRRKKLSDTRECQNTFSKRQEETKMDIHFFSASLSFPVSHLKVRSDVWLVLTEYLCNWVVEPSCTIQLHF